jgi:hypothetical protein
MCKVVFSCQEKLQWWKVPREYGRGGAEPGAQGPQPRAACRASSSPKVLGEMATNCSQIWSHVSSYSFSDPLVSPQGGRAISEEGEEGCPKWPCSWLMATGLRGISDLGLSSGCAGAAGRVGHQRQILSWQEKTLASGCWERPQVWNMLGW